jgi:hypothetical protein
MRKGETKEITYINEFKDDKFKDKWFICVSGPHFQDAKIFDQKTMIAIQEERNERHKRSSLTWNPEIQVQKSTPNIPRYTTTYMGPYNSFFEVKETLLRFRLDFVERLILNVTDTVGYDKVIRDRIRQIKGYEKTKKALQKWREKHPEYLI